MKKNVPLEVLQLGNEIRAMHSEIIEPVSENNSLLFFKDKDSQSNFFFQILKERPVTKSAKGEISVIHYSVVYRPSERNNLNKRTIPVDFDGVKKVFMDWISIVKEYYVTPYFLDDPIQEKY